MRLIASMVGLAIDNVSVTWVSQMQAGLQRPKKGDAKTRKELDPRPASSRGDEACIMSNKCTWRTLVFITKDLY